MSIWWWIGFNTVVLALLALDLGVFQRKAHFVQPKEALIWSGVWIALSLLFNLVIYFEFGSKLAGEFFAAYLLEKSLSVDNLFVFAVLFGYFKVAEEFQHRVLFFGILGALILRSSLIGIGSALVHEFEWITYVFGALLVVTGVRMAFGSASDHDVSKNPIIKFLHWLLPVSDKYYDDKFFIREAGKWLATPMLIVLIVIETSDLVFALDSIPAAFGVVQSKNAFIIFTSNVCAVLGLRALYFLVANLIHKFHLLNYGLSIVLCFVGVKMLLHAFGIIIDTNASLIIVAAVLVLTVLLSFIFPKKIDAVDALVSSEDQQSEVPLP